MSALEYGFPDPPSGAASYLSVAEAAFNTQAARWDTAGCNGGLRWQIFAQNKGYDYMNTISNGAFFQLAARLARYTGNQTYIDWAEKVWD
jgi:mannan endo-1,6-alpha-mannosidase